MRWYELYSEVNIVHGGLWWDPDEMAFVEVVDLESAASLRGANLVNFGYGSIKPKEIHDALASVALEHEEPEIRASIEKWAKAKDFKSLAKADQTNIHKLALAINGYSGFQTDKSDLVIDKAEKETAARAEDLAEEVRALRWFVTRDPKGKIWQLLRGHGIRKGR